MGLHFLKCGFCMSRKFERRKKIVLFQLSDYFTSEQDKITFIDSLFPPRLISSQMLVTETFNSYFKKIWFFLAKNRLNIHKSIVYCSLRDFYILMYFYTLDIIRRSDIFFNCMDGLHTVYYCTIYFKISNKFLSNIRTTWFSNTLLFYNILT